MVKPARSLRLKILPIAWFFRRMFGGKALERIIVHGVSPEQAADEAIARIKEIFDEWQ